MPKLTVDLGAAGPLQASLRNDVFPTEGLVHAGPVSISGVPARLRALAAALVDAAVIAEIADVPQPGPTAQEDDGKN
jgi:hypothetical protein